VSAAGGPNGIVWSNASPATGSLTVAGTGGAGTGGTIANLTGADAATSACAVPATIPAGTGVYLRNAPAVSLSSMSLHDFSNFAVLGYATNGFTLAGSTVNGTNGSNALQDEASLHFCGLTGTASLTNDTITGGRKRNVDIRNTTGSLTFSMTGTTIGGNDATDGDDAMLLQTSGGSLTATIGTSTFTSARGDLFQFNLPSGSPTGSLTFTGNTLSNNHPAIVGGGGGMTVSGDSVGGAATLAYTISNNTFRDAKGIALNVFKGDGAGAFSGTISGNTIGVPATADSGSSQASGIQVVGTGSGSHTVAITNNSIYQYNEAGILVRANQGSSAMNATITGNTTANPGAFAFAGLFADVGALAGDSNSVCLGATANNLSAGDPFNFSDISLSQTGGVTTRLPGYAGTAFDTAAVGTFVNNNNGGGNTVTVSASGSGYVGGAACAAP